MIKYIIKRLVYGIFALCAVIALNILIIEISPLKTIDEINDKFNATYYSNNHVSILNGLPIDIKSDIAKTYGLDMPTGMRIITTFKKYITFQLGESIFIGKPVIDIIMEGLKVSLIIGFFATVITISMAVILATKNIQSFNITKKSLIVISAMPGALTAIAATNLIFIIKNHSHNIYLNTHPLFEGSIMSIIVLALGSMAPYTYLISNQITQESKKYYIKAARSKNLSRKRIIYSHIMPNIMVAIASKAPQILLGSVFGSSIIIEIIYNIQGIGYITYNAMINQDYPLILGILYFSSACYILINILMDILYKCININIQFNGQK